MDIDLELYRIFCEVVKYGNISKASEQMYITQSAVTQSIKKLEEALGGVLFYRKNNGVELTEEGKNLYNYIKNSIEVMNNANNLFSNYINLEKGSIRIGGGNSIISSLILKPLMCFMKDYPNINISINNGLTSSLMQKLANGELDIVVLNLPYLNKYNSNIEITSLKKEQYVFFLINSYLEKNPIESFSDINKHKLILPKTSSSKRSILDNYAEKEGLEILANYEISSTSIMKRMVLNDIGVGFANLESLNDIKDKISIIKKITNKSIESGIANLNKKMCNKATLELINYIKRYYEN